MKHHEFLNSPKIQILTIILLTFFAYSNILQNDYLGDDRAFIQQWDFPTDVRNIPFTFTHRTNAPGLPLDYRPIMTTLLILGRSTWGENKLFFRLESIAIHLLVTVLIYFVVRELIKGYLKDKKKKFYSLRMFPFVAALLFGLHPIHTEVVDYVMVSIDNLAIVFLFASFYFYLRSKELVHLRSKELVHVKSTKKLPKFSSNYIKSLVFATLAFFTYEMTLTLPFLFMIYDFCFKTFRKNYIKNILHRYVPFILSASIYLWIRAALTLPGGDRGTYFLGSFYLNMIVMPKLIWKYVELQVLPINLSFIHRIADGLEIYPTPYSNISAIEKLTIFSPEVFFPSLSLLALFGIGIRCYKKLSLVTFGIGWFFISLLPVSNIVPIGVTFSERYSYLASFGYIFLLVIFFSFLMTYFKSKKVIVFLVLLLISFYFARTYIRNYDWRNMESLAKSILRVNPESLIARYNLASYYSSIDLGKAEVEYQTLIRIDHRVKEAHFDLGNVYLAQGRQDLASIEFGKTLVLDPNFIDAYVALGEIFLSKGQLREAEGYFNRALNVDPKNYLFFQLPKSEIEIAHSRSRAFGGLGEIYLAQNNPKSVIQYLSQALILNPDNDKARATYDKLFKKYPLNDKK